MVSGKGSIEVIQVGGDIPSKVEGGTKVLVDSNEDTFGVSENHRNATGNIRSYRVMRNGTVDSEIRVIKALGVHIFRKDPDGLHVGEVQRIRGSFEAASRTTLVLNRIRVLGLNGVLDLVVGELGFKSRCQTDNMAMFNQIIDMG